MGVLSFHTITAPWIYHSTFLTGRPQWKVKLVFILRIHDPVVEIMAETIFHTMISMSQSLFALDEGVSLECEGRTCYKNLDPSILKRVWLSEYDQPHNSHDHCHIVLEDNLISSQTIITSSYERENSSSFTSDGSEWLKCCYYDSVKAQQFSLVNGQLGRWVGSLSGCSAWRSVENYTCVNEPNSL